MNIQQDPITTHNKTPRTARAWAQKLSHYRQSSNHRGIVEILITATPFVLLWILMWVASDISYWLTLLLAIPTAAFLLRLFMIQHDCGHGSFFSHRMANDWIGRIIGVVTFTPYKYWQRMHALHHASSGSLEHRGFGDIDTLTVSEYQTQSKWERLKYRLYRHPLVMFGLGPAYIFLLQHRLPMGQMTRGWQPWLSTMGTNLSIAIVTAILIWLIGFKTFLLIQIPIIILAASVGVWLFFVQHQFEHTTWDNGNEWDRHEAALHGSSHYDLPSPIRWLTANIGIHHIHHLCSQIPFYKLKRTLDDHPELHDISRLTLLESFKCTRLVLWDETQRRLISFREARQLA